MKVVGLTGGIGSGKSTAARILAELGARIIDADRVGHEVYAPGRPGWDRVVEAFGSDVVAADGTIDRRKLGSLVFANPAGLVLLNRIVHPLIAQEIVDRIQAHRSSGRAEPLVLEAALLVETGWYALVDEVWLVVAQPGAVLERVNAQRGMSPAALQERIEAQLTDDQRRKHAQVVIENDGSPDDLRRRLEELWRARLGAPDCGG